MITQEFLIDLADLLDKHTLSVERADFVHNSNNCDQHNSMAFIHFTANDFRSLAATQPTII